MSNLSYYKKIEVATRLAHFRSVSEVVNHVKNHYKIDITPQAIRKTFLEKDTRWNQVMMRLRATYVAAVMDAPIAQKRVRLDRYDELYQEAKTQGKLSAAKACLDSAREEVEGAKTPSIGNIFFAQINNMSDEELRTERQKQIDKLEKLGIKPRQEVTDAQTTEVKDAESRD